MIHLNDIHFRYPEGEFSLSLPPGKFFLILRKRVEGEAVGPIRTGDYRSEIIGPVTIRSGPRMRFMCLCRNCEVSGIDSNPMTHTKPRTT